MAKERLTPAALIVLIILGLFTLVIFFYLFYSAELNEAIYASVLKETKGRLAKTVDSYISMVEQEEKLSWQETKKEVREEVENAWSIANALYLYCKKRGCSKRETEKLIKRVLRNYRFFHGKGYIFIDSVKGNVILNPFFPELEGKNLWNWKDARGRHVHREFERVALYSPENQGFVEYMWYRPDTKEAEKKIAFVKLFKPFNWIIGGGVYAFQVKETVRNRVLTVGRAFDAFIVDAGHENNPLLKGISREKLEKGVFLRAKDRFIFFKLHPGWNWVVGAYATDNEILRSVYLLKAQFLSKSNKVIVTTSIIVLSIVLISSGTLLKYNKRLEETIRELREKKRELLRLTRHLKLVAYRDDITNLPNRKKLFEDIANTDLSRNLHFAMINIRNFKEINELFGFEDGNKILKDFGRHLKKRVKSQCKKCMVYRIRADKFGVLACDFNDAEFIDFTRNLLKDLENREFEVNNLKFKLDLVAGISKNRDNLLIEAEIAEEEAKRKNLNLYMFDEELQKTFERLEKNLKIATILKEAVEKKMVVPFFQPIVNLQTGRVFEYEALMRIKTSDGILTPNQFLAVAKKIAIYPKLSKALLEEAFKVCAERRIRVSVNLSTEDISSPDTVNWILEALKHYDIAERVCFEVVETEAFNELKILEDFYFKVKEVGSYLAIDDFGSGYSNYEYLATVKPDFVKIDGSLISKIPRSKEVEKLVKHIVMFCKDLEIKTIAEFVSNEELYAKVLSLGVDYGQGYYFGKPEPEIRP